MDAVARYQWAARAAQENQGGGMVAPVFPQEAVQNTLGHRSAVMTLDT